MVGLLVVSAVLAVLPLFLILGFIVKRGSINWAFFSRLPVPPGKREAAHHPGNSVDGRMAC
jgi:hypothetical protein